MYLRDKQHLKSIKATTEHLAAILWAYAGRRLSALAEVARKVREEHHGAPGTIRNRLAVLKAACRHAWKHHGLTKHDPTSRMQLPKVRNERHVYADRREMLTLARAADRHDVRVMIRTAFYSGMRLGELMRVEVRDTFLLADTKNDDRRSIPIHPKLRTCLPYLPLMTGKSTLERGFHRARVRVGLAHMRIHDLRHSAASEMVNAGVDLYSIGKVLGHRDPKSTQRYAHLTHRTLADAVGKIGRKPSDKPKAA